MLKNKIIFIILIIANCCTNNDDSNYYKKIYNGLTENDVYSKFIGYHIVKRSEVHFLYKNLLKDSSEWESIPYNIKEEKSEQNFYEENINSRLQFEIMNRYNIKAVITDNFNSNTKKLENSENVGYDFKEYELTFMISDSIQISNINFGLKEYTRLIKDHYSVVEKLDSTWVVLKRL